MCVCRARARGRVGAGWDTDGVAVGSDAGTVALLRWTGAGFVPEVGIAFDAPGCLRTVPGQFVAGHPSGAALIAGVCAPVYV